MNKKEEILVFTDGSSLGNPGPGGWGSIIVNDTHVKEMGGGEKHTTNNRMEILAAIEALRSIGGTKKNILVYTDSSYAINGITKWVHGWARNNWILANKKDEVQNRDLWEKFVEMVKGKNIRWTHVSGHSGMPGNERADHIATSFARAEKTKLFDGDISAYSVDILKREFDEKALSKRRQEKAREKKKAYSYLSMVDGEIKIHSHWAECEKRVKGKRGVKFKKSLSPEDEKSIIADWKRA